MVIILVMVILVMAMAMAMAVTCAVRRRVPSMPPMTVAAHLAMVAVPDSGLMMPAALARGCRKETVNLTKVLFTLLSTTMLRVLRAITSQRQKHHRRHQRIRDERLGRPDRARVHHLVAHAESLRVDVEVMPHHAEIEVEYIPADPAPRPRANRRRIPDKAPAVDAE
jgi:hypothetical protein